MANYRQTVEENYYRMEETLQIINRDFISLSDDEVKRNNVILDEILGHVIENMCEDELFDYLYRDKYYGGSYYDGLKVTQPDEYDLDLRLDLDEEVRPKIKNGNIAGFVYVHLRNMEYLRRNNPAIYSMTKRELLDENDYLITTKVLSWMENVVRTAVDNLPTLQIEGNTIQADVVQKGPAFTLQLEGFRRYGEDFQIDIDLVPSFVFSEDNWPVPPFRQNPVKDKSEFFVVPKKPYRKKNNIGRYWRLSFQEQESILMTRKKNFKPALRLLKKLTVTQPHMRSIASYYLKTVFLWELKYNKKLWSKPLSYVFIKMLKKYQRRLDKGKIPYYWNPENNLLDNLHPDTSKNIANYLQHTIEDIEENPENVAEYLLDDEELDEFDYSME